MNTRLYLLIGAAALLSACSSPKENKNESPDTQPEKVTYSGVLPAADAPGVRYVLTLDYDDNQQGGNFNLSEVYLDSENLEEANPIDSLTFNTDGNFTVNVGTPQSASQKYIKLTPAKSSDGADDIYFVIDSDSTITMVSSSLTTAVSSDLNYTLQKTE